MTLSIWYLKITVFDALQLLQVYKNQTDTAPQHRTCCCHLLHAARTVNPYCFVSPCMCCLPLYVVTWHWHCCVCVCVHGTKSACVHIVIFLPAFVCLPLCVCAWCRVNNNALVCAHTSSCVHALLLYMWLCACMHVYPRQWIDTHSYREQPWAQA